MQTIKDTLHFHLAHDDLTKYNAVQKLLYIGVICVGIMMVVSGLAIWKPVQFSELLSLFGSFQNARLVHFLCMSAIVLFRRRACCSGAAGAAHAGRRWSPAGLR